MYSPDLDGYITYIVTDIRPTGPGGYHFNVCRPDRGRQDDLARQAKCSTCWPETHTYQWLPWKKTLILRLWFSSCPRLRQANLCIHVILNKSESRYSNAMKACPFPTTSASFSSGGLIFILCHSHMLQPNFFPNLISKTNFIAVTIALQRFFSNSNVVNISLRSRDQAEVTAEKFIACSRATNVHCTCKR